MALERKSPPIPPEAGERWGSLKFNVGRRDWEKRRKEELAGGGGGDGYAEFFELGAGAALFFGAGVALDDFA